MKRLTIILTFITSSFFAQYSPMFDSIDYFTRNKIKTVHCYPSTWYYAPFWSYAKYSFDKKLNTLNCNSMKFDNPNSKIAKDFKPSVITDFLLRDTLIWVDHRKGYDTINYLFDKKNRLNKVIHISSYGTYKKGEAFVTSKNYFYDDSMSKKLKKIVIESPYVLEERNFYYTNSLLSTMTCKDSNKIDNKITFEILNYDYYPDKKLKRETRRINTDHCPTICEGTIDYKYDTEFKNDSTPVTGLKPVEDTVLLTIKNKRKAEVYVELWGYPDNTKKQNKAGCFSYKVKPENSFYLTYRNNFLGIKPADSYPLYKKDKYEGFEIFVYQPEGDSVVIYGNTPKDTLFFARETIENLFKKQKNVTIKNKK